MNNAIISHWLYGPALYDFALYVPVNKWTLLNRQPSSAWLKDPSGILRGNRKMKSGSSGSAKSTGKTSPRTGDPSNPMLWIVLLILSITGVVGLAVWRRRHKAWPGILSVFRELWCRNREFIGSCKATFDKKADLSAELWLQGSRSGSCNRSYRKFRKELLIERLIYRSNYDYEVREAVLIQESRSSIGAQWGSWSSCSHCAAGLQLFQYICLPDLVMTICTHAGIDWDKFITAEKSEMNLCYNGYKIR